MKKSARSPEKKGANKSASKKDKSVMSAKIQTSLLDSIGSSVLFIDPQTAEIVDANAAACKFYGYSHKDLIQKRILDLAAIPVEEARERIRKIAAGEITHMTLPHRLANGEIREVFVDLGHTNLKGRPVNVATIYDITEREQVKNKLHDEKNYRQSIKPIREGFSTYEVLMDDWLALSEKHFRDVFEAFPLACFIWKINESDDFVLVDINHKADATTQNKAHEFIGHTSLEIYFDRPDIRDALKRCLVEKTTFSLETPYTSRGTGGSGYIIFTYVFVEPDKVMLFSENITQRRQAEMALRESEARFASMFKVSPTGINIFDLKTGRTLQCNDAFLELTGYTAEELHNHTAAELNLFVNTEDRSRWMRILKQDRMIKSTPTSFRRKSGELRHAMASLAIFENGGDSLCVVMTNDITDLKNTEATLQAAHDKLDLLVQERTRDLSITNERLKLATSAAKLGIWDWDVQANRLLWDQQMYQLYGIRPEDFCGTYEAWLQGLHPDDRQRSAEIVQCAIHGEGNYDTEFRVIWPDGSTHWLKTNGQVFFDEAKRPIRVTGVNYDITERVQAEEQLKKMGNLMAEGQRIAHLGSFEYVAATGRRSGLRKNSASMGLIQINLLPIMTPCCPRVFTLKMPTCLTELSKPPCRRGLSTSWNTGSFARTEPCVGCTTMHIPFSTRQGSSSVMWA